MVILHGYFEEKPSTLKNPVDVVFTSNGTECPECENFPSIICGWYKNSLFFIHFYTNYDFCDDCFVRNYWNIFEQKTFSDFH